MGSAAPAVQAWNMGPTCLSVPTLYQSQASRMLEKERMIAQRMFDMVDLYQHQHQVVRYPSQPYELIDNNEKFELKVDVPGVKEEDIDIKLDDGKLTVEGQRMGTSETSKFASKFSKIFSLDQTVDVDRFTANLKNDVLVVSAPKDLAKLQKNIRRIPITSVADDTLSETTEKTATSDSQHEEHNKEAVDEEKVEIPLSSPKAKEDNDTQDLDASDSE